MRRILALSLFSFGLPLASGGCSGGDQDDDNGSGGTGSGDATGGSAAGTGGSVLPASGGQTQGTGGTTTGGAPGSGGQPSGGAPGTGGDAGGSGGGQDPGSGGDAGTGGDTGTGGDEGTGGGATVGSSGCGNPASSPDSSQQQTIQVGNLTRYYLFHVPDNYDPDVPLPLIFAIHGLNMNNVWAAHDDSGFKLIEATDNQALIVYPQGIQANGQSNPPSSQSQWGDADSNWGGPPPNANADRLNADLSYFDAMLEFVQDNYCVDTDRIFAMGFSQGGFMTNALGCERSDVFRGLAPVAGWGPWGSNPSCSNESAAQAVIMTQGDTDGTVTPALGQATRDFWLDRANCQASGSPSQDFTPNCTEYTCDAGLPVVYCTHGGNHFVPGEAGPRGWDFFQSLD